MSEMVETEQRVAAGEEELPGRLTVASRSQEVGDNEGQFDAAVEGDEARIAFKYNYSVESLAQASPWNIDFAGGELMLCPSPPELIART